MRISASLPQGVTALLFDAARRRRRLEARLVERLGEAGFSEVVLPIVDYLEPYEPLLTAETRAELYRFVDRDGELLALRADFTPLLARLLAPMLGPTAGGAGPLELPLRLFYRGDVVRYEEERPGRQREFYQVGAELLGEPGPAAEREMLACFLELLSTASRSDASVDDAADGAAAGADGETPGDLAVRVVLGFAGALDAPLAAAAAAGADPGRLADALTRRERRPLRAPGEGEWAEGGFGSDTAWADVLFSVCERGVPERPMDLGPQAAARLAELESLREEMAAIHPGTELVVDLAEFAHQTLDPALASSLAAAPPPGASGEAGPPGERSYYDGIIFRAYAGSLALPAGAGGRYDGLFRRLGAEVPAVGFTLGLDRLTDGARRPRPRRPEPAAATIGETR